MRKKVIPNKEIGARIRVARKERGLTQMQLAEKVGVSFQQIQKYETGKDRIFVERLQQIAQALKVPISYFFKDFNEKVSSNGEEYAYELIPKELKEILPLSKEEIDILKKLRLMNDKLRASFLNQLEAVAETVEEKSHEDVKDKETEEEGLMISWNNRTYILEKDKDSERVARFVNEFLEEKRKNIRIVEKDGMLKVLDEKGNVIAKAKILKII